MGSLVVISLRFQSKNPVHFLTNFFLVQSVGVRSQHNIHNITLTAATMAFLFLSRIV